MIDQVTTGMLVAGALSLGSEASKAAVSEVVKDAYHALKTKLEIWAPHDVAKLEETPTSEGRKAVVAEMIDGLSLQDQKLLGALARDLTEKLQKNRETIGLDISRLEAYQVELGNISVLGGGKGARIEKAKVSGAFKTGKISVRPLKGN